MKYYRCKCGKSEAWGSYPPVKCVGCPTCDTTLELHPDYHEKPSPHEFVTKYDEYTGKPYQICLNCLKEARE